MDNKKFEQLIDLIINENEEQARALFHDIVVEKSREIYEGMMDDDMDEGMGGQVGQMMDEISAEQSGVVEAEDEEEFDMSDEDDGEDEVVDIETDDEGGEGEENLEDRVVDLEDKLDQLMAEFEDIMNDEGESDAEFDDGAEEDGEDLTHDLEAEHDGDEPMMENVNLKQVGGKTYNTYGKMGDDGAQTKSPGLQNSGQAGMDSKPVKFSGQSEAVPSSPKGPSNAYSKGETQVKDASNWKNAPGKDNFKDKGESAPKPVTTDEAGKVKSPVAESRTAKKRI